MLEAAPETSIESTSSIRDRMGGCTVQEKVRLAKKELLAAAHLGCIDRVAPRRLCWRVPQALRIDTVAVEVSWSAQVLGGSVLLPIL